MKNLMILISLGLSTFFSQPEASEPFTKAHFGEQVLQFVPQQRAGVSDEDFRKGCFFLEEVKNATEQKAENLNCADYWNVTMAFIRFQEPKAHIELAFQSAIEANLPTICSYVDMMGSGNIPDFIPELFADFQTRCPEKREEEAPVDLPSYAKEHGVSLPLVELMHQIGEDDQLYRGKGTVDWSLQTPLDKENELSLIHI